MSEPSLESNSQGRSLQGYLFVALFGGALLVFLGTTTAASSLYERLLYQKGRVNSEAQAQIAAEQVRHLAQAGLLGQQLYDYLAINYRVTNPRDGASGGGLAPDVLSTRVYTTPLVAPAYALAPPPNEGAVQTVLHSGRPQVIEQEQRLRYLAPLLVPEGCDFCTAGARPGEVLGVVEVIAHLQVVPPEVRLRNASLFLLFAGLVLLIAALSSHYAVRSVSRPVARFRQEVRGIGAVKDLVHLNPHAVDFGFRELNQLYRPVAELIDKLRDIAVDRDILEFEVRLLGKFIITSEVVRDWREYVQRLLIEINEILPAYALITLFKVDEERYELDIFWHHEPSEAAKEIFSQIARSRLQSPTSAADLKILHFVADPSARLPDLTTADIEVQTKALTLDQPRIGGIAGIGVQSRIAQDPIRHIVVDSILTTLVNLVGSVKAIYKYTQDLEYYATRDPLTNLYNQRVFWELLDYEVSRAHRHGQPFAVVVIDLDNFKSVNDRYGHDFGDRFICHFGDTVQKLVRQGDIVARYGGDEFALILPDSGREQSWLVAERIRKALEELSLPAPDGVAVRATTSLGIALFPDHGATAKDLFTIADNMMYKAKRGGKNAVSLPSAEDVATVHREAGEKARMVMAALEEQRIVPYFQPILALGDGGVPIHEVLMRIELPERVVSAGEFIEIAEGLGVIHRMDYLLIERAFEQARQQDYDGMLFINVSPRALIVGEFLERVRSLATRYGIQPGRIVLELTERDTVKNVTLLERFISELKSEGFKFAIDDFGSGFSSFHYIRRLPIDYLKIEGEFVRSMLEGHKDMALIDSMLTLARGLNIATVAEYVENEELLQALRGAGCDYGQGFHIGRPSARFVTATSAAEA